MAVRITLGTQDLLDLVEALTEEKHRLDPSGRTTGQSNYGTRIVHLRDYFRDLLPPGYRK